MELFWHKYKYYPYERELALREISSLLSPNSILPTKHGVKVEAAGNIHNVERLVYFSEAINEGIFTPTLQYKLEKTNGNAPKRQSTRYSVHGLHEYKGKFNPQIARAILNILNIPEGSKVLDPFCGSGTSLVECAHMGIQAIGTDINPLAVFLANAKLLALSVSAESLTNELTKVIQSYQKLRKLGSLIGTDERSTYLKSWFNDKELADIESLYQAITSGNKEHESILLAIASNLLRDYSLQDPQDLRIRRRKSPLPEVPFIETFERSALLFISRLNEAQALLAGKTTAGKAILIDSRNIKLGNNGISKDRFDCAITSPPYATALPYIDTQRLSLVWLGLLPPSKILTLESELVGSREMRGAAKKELFLDLLNNRAGIPSSHAKYCQDLQDAIGERDGFRRQVVPSLLYRYFAGMADVFTAVNRCMKEESYFALIVGSNHTTLGGHRFDIDTPSHLAELSKHYGWLHIENFPLQTYQRYGYHQGNAVSNEALVILKKP